MMWHTPQAAHRVNQRVVIILPFPERLQVSVFEPLKDMVVLLKNHGVPLDLALVGNRTALDYLEVAPVSIGMYTTHNHTAHRRH
jgi:hypothetical protein